MSSRRMRALLISVAGLFVFGQSACSTGPGPYYRQSQLRSLQLYQQNQSLAFERDQAIGQAQSEAVRSEQLARENAALQAQLGTANQRLANLNAERSQLKDQVLRMINQARTGKSPLGGDSTRRFEELARQYPEFEFDPYTGVSKFHSDILFDTGSAQIKPRGAEVLQKFAEIMSSGEARRLNVLVVGHTDDQRIARGSTRAKHPTNWHLSTNRANSVVLALEKYGVKSERMGAAGYSKYQPVAPNKDAASRQKNRRVEIFVLAPDARVAGWDPESSRE